jgi:alpha-D-xyloside xylohydrolase
MKFTDGAWLMQPGVQAHHPAEVNAVTHEGDELVVRAPTRPIRHRGDTLQGPLLTIRLSSPMANVVRVRVEHFTGGGRHGPHIPLQTPATIPAAVRIEPDQAVLSSGSLSVTVKRTGGWELVFSDGERVLTRSAGRGMGYVQWAGKGSFMHEQLGLGVGENVYGLGERFTALVKNGQAVPFYLTNRGYGVLVNETGPVSFEVASERVSRVQFSVPGEALEYFIIAGPTPKDVLRHLTALTGRPALPPAWSFGLWLSTSFTTNYDEATITSFIDGMKQRDLPLHVFHFDCFWMREFEWTNFEWDPRVFPDPAGMLQRLRARGLKVCVWINPYIAQCSRLFATASAQGFLLKRTDGSVWQTDLWQPGMGIVDFTNPPAAAWFAGHIRGLLAMGVDAIKTDFGERIPVDGVAWHDGSDATRMHNHYPVIYNETVFRAIEAERGQGDAVLFARAAYASSQRFPVHWGGDCWSTMESMAESLRGGLSLGLCGFGFWSHDIGGFEGTAPAYIYKRWAAFGLLSSHSRLHGSSSYRVPWAYDEEACDVVRFFTKLKCRLMPTLWAAAHEAHREGVPMMRAMLLEFPADPAAGPLDRQYMLGGSLLVAPVFEESGRAEYYLPAGNWTHLLTGEAQAGGRWHQAQHGFLSLPIFVRPGTVLALGAQDDRPDYEFSEGVTFRVYELADGASATCTVPALRGDKTVTCTVARTGDQFDVKVEGAVGAWRVQLAGVAAVKSAAGIAPAADPLGVMVAPAAGTRSLRLVRSTGG